VSEFKPNQMPSAPSGGLRLGGRLGGLDPSALAKAEAALKSLSSNFAEWMNNEITKLDAAWDLVRAQGATQAAMDSLYLRAHDLKGLGTTYGFPIVTGIAAQLCRQIGDGEARLSASLDAIGAQIAAIKMAVSQNITTEDQPEGQALLASLRNRVSA
jgi:hypothetical protein